MYFKKFITGWGQNHSNSRKRFVYKISFLKRVQLFTNILMIKTDERPYITSLRQENNKENKEEYKHREDLYHQPPVRRHRLKIF